MKNDVFEAFSCLQNEKHDSEAFSSLKNEELILEKFFKMETHFEASFMFTK